MNRTQDPTKETDKYGSGKHGYSEGSPGVVSPTRLRATDANAWQEEIVRTIEAAGLTPDAADLGQLAVAAALLPFQKMAVYGLTGITSDYLTFAAISGISNPSGWSLSESDTRITAPAAGVYAVFFQAAFTSPDTTNPTDVGVFLRDSASVNLSRFITKRTSATAAHVVQVNGFAVVNNTVGTFKLRTVDVAQDVALPGGLESQNLIAIVKVR